MIDFNIEFKMKSFLKEVGGSSASKSKVNNKYSSADNNTSNNDANSDTMIIECDQIVGNLLEWIG